MVFFGRRWYLLAWDRDRHDWRSFRTDRIDGPPRPFDRFTARRPDADPADLVGRGVASVLWSHRAKVTLQAPATRVALIDMPPTWLVEAVDDERCSLGAGAESRDRLAVYLASLGVDFTVDDDPQLVAAVAALGERCRLAVARVHEIDAIR